MNEVNSKYVLNHPGGSETHFYPGSEVKKADRFTKTPLTEKDLLQLVEKFPLPFSPKSLEIVGFGGYSVALRITFQDNRSFVGVLRYQDTELPDDPSNKLILSHFEGYTLDEWSIVCADAEGNKLTFKFVPEVKGATLKDISLLHLLSNKTLLRKFADFSVQVVDLFKQQKVLPDLVGHSQRGLSYFPFFTSNLMVEFGTNQLKLVDTDLLPNNILAEVSKIRQLILLIRVTSVYFSGMLANTVATFLEKEAEVALEAIEYDQGFIEGVRDVVEVLESQDVDYRVLGSVAVASNLEDAGILYPLSARRKGGSRREIDILVLNKSLEEIKQLEQLFNKKQQENENYPEVSFSSPQLPVSNSDSIFQSLLPRLTSRFALDESSQKLVQRHGDLEMEIPESDFKPQRQQYRGVEFNTVNPNVLLGLVITRNGVIKFKDMEKFELFFENVVAEIPPQYLDFARQIRSQHRKEYRNFIGRQWLSILTRGIFDGSFTKLLKRNN